MAVVKGNVDAKSVMDTIRKANARHAKVKLHRRRSSNTHPRFELQEKGSSSEGSARSGSEGEQDGRTDSTDYESDDTPIRSGGNRRREKVQQSFFDLDAAVSDDSEGSDEDEGSDAFDEVD
jgi:hypothetical protein